MGNILKLLTREEQEASESQIDIFLDFENATPTESEREVYNVVSSVLDEAPRILKELQDYQGANEEIRQAISNALNGELQELAWKAVVPLVGKLKEFYEYALELGELNKPHLGDPFSLLSFRDFPSKVANQETYLFCLRVMVGLIILYDHVHPIGAFVKNSAIDIKASIKVLKDQPQGSVDGLLNALRYSTKHLNDETTPKNIKALLM
ncbi:PREDICTED: protein FAM49B-like [Acropora digitifera]|uniref:protein FAM49B-like n=1 Tax=Acropora digitifera TaxID=70779 RepID=UPI00077AF919|nr:PREDICTED: protein FAM49B-like [Acropora digitifera]